MHDCDFCLIAQRRQEAEIVAEGQDWIAFFPLEPATPGHTLVVPRDHVPDLWHLDRHGSQAIARAVISVGNAIRRALDPEGMNLISSSGTAAEQTVFHLHLHVVPRWSDDGFGRIWPPDGPSLSRRAKEGLANRIRHAVSDLEALAPPPQNEL